MPDYNEIKKQQEQILQQSAPVTPYNIAPTVTYEEAGSGRFPRFYSGLDNEDIYGQNQSTGEKWKFAAGKFAATAATTFVAGTAGLINGLYQWADDGKFSSFYNNDFNKSLDELTKNLETTLPTYYTTSETNAPWYSPKTWGTANFWSDTIFKNSGFAVGAILSGGVWGKAISPLISGISKAVSRGAAAEIAAISEEAAITGRTVNSVNARISDVLQNTAVNQQALNIGARATQAGMATFGEASLEALNAHDTYVNELKRKYQDTHGTEPAGQDLSEIEGLADEVGNITFGANMALLSVTNYIQFPKIMNNFWSGAKAEAFATERGLGRVAMQGEDVLTQRLTQVTRPRALRILDRVKGYSGVFSRSEAFEEGAQYAVPVAAQDWVEKGNTNEQDIISSVGKGLKAALTEKQGLLSILSGGITGGIMERVGGLRQEGLRGLIPASIRERSQLNRNTQTFIQGINNNRLFEYLKVGAESVNRAATLNQEMNNALENNDRLGYEDARIDETLNYLLPRIQYGRFDLALEEIQGYKELALTNEGWENLKDQGLVSTEASKEDFLANLARVERIGIQSQAQFENLNNIYGTQKNEQGALKYSPKVLLTMAYTGAKIEDYSTRINSLLPILNSSGFVITPYLQKDEISPEDIQEIQENINNLNLDPEPERLLKEAVGDILELNARKKLKIQEYEQLRDYPELYRGTDRPIIPPDEDPLDQVQTQEEIADDQRQYLQEIARATNRGEELSEEDITLRDQYPELFQQFLDLLEKPVNTKQVFVQANEGIEFQMNVNGTFQTGTISLQDDKLFFNYGDTQTEISNADFQDGTIQGEFQDPENYLLTTDPRTEVLPQGRILQRAKDLLNQAQTRSVDIQKQIDQKTTEVERITQEIRNEGTTNYFTRNMVEDMMVLQEMRQETENAIRELQTENEGLQVVIAEYQVIIDSKPGSLQHQLDLLEEQQVQLEQQNLNNNLLQTALTNLLNASTDLLTRLGRKVMSKVYSWNRTLAGQPAFQTVQRAMEIYEQDPTQENLQQALQLIQTNTELIQNLDSKPLTEGERKWITDKLQVIEDQLQNVEPLLQAKQEVLQQLQDTQEDIDTREELFQENIPENFVEEEEVTEAPTQNTPPITTEQETADFINEVMQNLVTNVGETAAEKIKEYADRIEAGEPKESVTQGLPPSFVSGIDSLLVTPQETFPDDGAKIPLNILPEATTVPLESMRKEDWYLRFSNFLNVLSTMPRSRRANIRVVTVTKTTEQSQGLTGLVDFYNKNNKGEPYIPTDTNDAPITLVIQEIKEDGTRVFLDQTGNETTDISKMVITKKRASKLTWSDGQPNYSRATPEEAQAKLLEWQAQRAQEVNSPTPREYAFTVSGGREDTGKKVPIVGNLITEEQAQTEKVLQVVGSKGITDQHGNKTNTKPGDIVLKTEDTVQKVYTRSLSDKDYQIIQGTLLHIAKVAKQSQNKVAEDKITNLINFLQGTVNITLGGDNYSTAQIGRTKSTLSQEKISDPSYVPALRSNITNTNINRNLLEKNQAFTEVIGFEQDGTPLLKVWPTYQEYILNPQNPLLDGYNKIDRYLVLNEKVGSQARTQEEKIVPLRKPKQPKTPTGEDKNLRPQDKVTYTDQKLKTPAGKDITLSGNFTILITKSSGQDTFIDPKGNRITIPQGVNVIRLDGTNEIYYLSNAAHNKTSNKKSYKTSNITPQEFEVEDILPSSDPIMETESEIPQEVVAVVNEEQSVLQGTTIILPKVEQPKNPSPREQGRLPKTTNIAELEIGDTAQLTTRSGNIETMEVIGFKGDRTTVKVTTTNPQGDILREEEFDSRKGSVITKEILKKKQENQIPQQTIPEITPNCE